MPLLDANALTVTYPRKDSQGRWQSWTAVAEVSFSIGRGELVGFVGESGSGKTTLAKALLGLEKAASGTVRFEGRDVAHLSGAERRRFRRVAQMIFQDPMGALNPRLTIGDTLAEVLSVHQVVARQDQPGAVRDLLRQVGLDPDYAGRYPHEFSGGQRQRIGIARALALDPQLLVADEPVSALDVSVQAQVLNLLRDLCRQRNMALILVAHDLAVVQYVCERVLVMYQGRVVEQGPCATVFAKPQHPYTRLLRDSVPDPDDVRHHLSQAACAAEEPAGPPGGSALPR